MLEITFLAKFARMIVCNRESKRDGRFSTPDKTCSKNWSARQSNGHSITRIQNLNRISQHDLPVARDIENGIWIKILND